jgi:hypothetical protein
MQAVLHKLAIGLITFHIVGGCCLHHAHAWNDAHAAEVSPSLEVHCVPDRHPRSDCPDPPGHPTELCREGICQFFAPHKTRPGELPSVLPATNLAGLCPHDDALLFLSRSEALIAARGQAWHGLRLHLVHQVLLL